MLSAGLPVVGTAKAARGYGDPSGITVVPMPHSLNDTTTAGGAMAAALVSLHEDSAAWGAAQAAALSRTAELGAALRGGADVDVILRACGVAET